VLTGIDTKEQVEFIPQSEQGSENPTIFMIGVLTNREKLKIMGDAVTPDGQLDTKKLADKSIDVVRGGLKGIKNFSGQDLIAPVTDAVIDSIPFDVLMEIFSKVMELNFLNAESKKKSS
jgi:hypothetical protein